MALLLRESDVQGLIDMDAVVAALEASMKELGEGKAQNQPRRRVFPPGGVLNVMFASWPGGGHSGFKSYTVAGGKARFLVGIYDLDGMPQALIEADFMGTYRTGAATGVAARALANAGPAIVGMIGSGWQARTQVQALARTLEIAELRVFSRTPEKRAAFAQDCSRDFGVKAVAADSAEAALRGAGVVVTITTSAEPVLREEWVEAGAVVVGAGSNFPNRAELPAELVHAADRVVVDQLDTARLESGDLIMAGYDFEKAAELGKVLAGSVAGRRSDRERIVFESHGLALWDVAAGTTVLKSARERGVGEEIRLFR